MVRFMFCLLSVFKSGRPGILKSVMPTRKRKESSVLLNEEHTFGWIFVEERQRLEDCFEEKVEDAYVWIKEVLIEIKKSLKT